VLFSKLRERFRLAVKKCDRHSQELTLKFIERWVKKASGEIEHSVIEAIRVFSEREVAPQLRRSTDLDGRDNDTFEVDYTRAPKVDLGHCKGLWIGRFRLLDLPAIEIARQMTYWSCVRYYAVQRSELVDGAWQKPRLKHRAPNISALYAHGNQIAMWVPSEILRAETAADRQRTVSFFVDVMRNLWELQNYFDAFSIFGGLDSGPIYRLKKLTAALPPKDVATLELVRKYWTETGSCPLKRQLHDNAAKSKNPSIPYIGLLLSDLFRYCEAEIPSIRGELINISKFTTIHKFIKAFEMFKKPKYCFLPVDQVLEKLGNLPIESEDWQNQKSEELEAPHSGSPSG
jgi:hypothetical protein